MKHTSYYPQARGMHRPARDWYKSFDMGRHRQRMTSISIAEIERAFEQLGSLPAVRRRLFELAEDPSASSTDIGEVIALDPSLTVRLLSEANGISKGEGICDVAASEALLQKDEMLAIARSCIDRTSFEGIPISIVDFMDYWSNSVCCALAANAIARKCSIEDARLMYTIGLLCNVGGALLYLIKPHEMRQILEGEFAKAAVEGVGTERLDLGTDQAEVTSQLLHHLGISNRVCEVIRHYQEPYRAQVYVKDTYALHVADTIAREMRPSTKSGSLRDAKSTLHPSCSRFIDNLPMMIDEIKRDVEIAFDYAYELIEPSII